MRSIEPNIPSYVNKNKFSSNQVPKQSKLQSSKREEQPNKHSNNKREQQPIPVKKNNWRQQHEDLVRSLRAAREVNDAIKSGKPLPPPQPPAANLDYITCDFCGRRFNESAAQRHIDFCKGQHDRLPKGKADVIAAQKQATRLNYKPPTMKARKPGAYYDAGSKGIPSSDPFINLSSNSHDEPNYGPGRPVKSIPPHPIAGTRSGHGSRTAKPTQHNISQSTSYVDSPTYNSNSNGQMAGDTRVIGRGRASANRGTRLSDNPPGRMITSTSHTSSLNKFCCECGSKYPTATSKFCSECGTAKTK